MQGFYKDKIICLLAMNEIQFRQLNLRRWEKFETLLSDKKAVSPDLLSDLFIQLTDDLAYARTYFPETRTVAYLNQLAQQAHQQINRNRPNNKKRIASFWLYEFPLLFYRSRKAFWVSFTIFMVSLLIGILSDQFDKGFVRIIMGDSYVNMTLDNIEKGDPLAVYKKMNQVDMFLGITINNIKVSFYAFAFGLLTPIGAGYILLRNGVTLGTFQSFLEREGFLLDSLATIWIHGTLEIFAIIVAGAAGILMGNSILFPGSYSRLESFRRGAQKGSKMVLGLVPVFIAAAFLEGFVTRYTQAPYAIRFSIILISLLLIVCYFYLYPRKLIKNSIYDKQNHQF